MSSFLVVVKLSLKFGLALFPAGLEESPTQETEDLRPRTPNTTFHSGKYAAKEGIFEDCVTKVSSGVRPEKHPPANGIWHKAGGCGADLIVYRHRTVRRVCTLVVVEALLS